MLLGPSCIQSGFKAVEYIDYSLSNNELAIEDIDGRSG